MASWPTVVVMPGDTREWTVGKLARTAGISVRTLHHYDRIGLLAPSGRSAAGHRRYREPDVERLYRILALRRWGFGLAAIVDLLDADQGSLAEATRAQLEHVGSEIGALQHLRARLSSILESLERSTSPPGGKRACPIEGTSLLWRAPALDGGRREQVHEAPEPPHRCRSTCWAAARCSAASGSDHFESDPLVGHTA